VLFRSFRENNETLYFTHTSPISSSIVNLGVKAFCNDYYSYAADKRTYRASSRLTAPPDLPTIANDPIDNYRWEINGVDGVLTTGKAMALPSSVYSSWKFRNSGNKTNNFIPSGVGLPSYRTLLSRVYVYPFDLLNFNNFNGGYNTEPNTLTYTSQSGSPNNVYKVPRSGNYIISGSLTFAYAATDGNYGNAAAFKPVAVVERCLAGADITNDNSWQYVDATTLRPIRENTQFYNQIYSFGPANVLIFDGPGYSTATDNYQYYNLSVATSSTFIAGDYIRFRFYLIDISNIMGKTVEEGAKSFKFFINGVNPSISDAPSLNKGFFQIYDPNTTVTLYEYTSSYGQTPQLFTTSSINTLLFSPSS
jgi:hypothetical protein